MIMITTIGEITEMNGGTDKTTEMIEEDIGKMKEIHTKGVLEMNQKEVMRTIGSWNGRNVIIAPGIALDLLFYDTIVPRERDRPARPKKK
jgi:hypothetical protein